MQAFTNDCLRWLKANSGDKMTKQELWTWSEAGNEEMELTIMHYP